MMKWLKKKALDWGFDWLKSVVTIEWLMTQIASILQWFLSKVVVNVGSEKLQKWCLIFKRIANFFVTLGDACANGVIETHEVAQLMNEATDIVGVSELTTETLHIGLDKVKAEITEKIEGSAQ